MRHRVYGKHFSRNKDERDLLFKSLIASLFLRGSIETSTKKAAAVKGLVDKIINNAKNKNRQHLLQTYLTDKQLRERLVKEIVPKLGNRNSGYTSLVKVRQRAGDATLMVKMSLIGVEKLGPLEKIRGNRQPSVAKEDKAEEKVVAKSVRKTAPVREKASPVKPARKRATK